MTPDRDSHLRKLLTTAVPAPDPAPAKPRRSNNIVIDEPEADEPCDEDDETDQPLAASHDSEPQAAARASAFCSFVVP